MSMVFEALADPTRRAILDDLRVRGPLSLGDVAAPLAMTRQGATKHLDVLVAAGLVRTERVGRRRMHALDAAPLEDVQEWLAPYAAEWDRRLQRLRRHVDGADDESPATPSPRPQEAP